MEKITKRIKNKRVEFEREMMKKTSGYILTSFGLVAGLAWNEAIKSFIETLFPLQTDTLKAKFIYALIITFALVLVSLYLTRLFRKDEKKEEAKK